MRSCSRAGDGLETGPAQSLGTGKVRQVGTLLLAGTKVGKGKPAENGLWRVGRTGTLGDGNLLTRGT